MNRTYRMGESIAIEGAPKHRRRHPSPLHPFTPSPVHRHHTTSTFAHRSGFTLLEVMLVLFVLVTATAMAWPLLSRSMDRARLTNAAEKIQADWGKARVQAISTGLPHVFRFETETGAYSIVPWEDENAMLEISMTPGYGTSAMPGAVATTNYTGAATTTGPMLPEGMVFVGIERGGDTRTLSADANLAATGTAATSPPVVFYPDGTSSDATLIITNQKGHFIAVTVRGLTGVTRVGEVTTEPGVMQ